MSAITNVLSSVAETIISPCRSRKLTGVMSKVTAGLAITAALYHLWVFTVGTYDIYFHRVIHVGTILTICFLTYSYSKKQTGISIIDIIFAFVTLGIMIYMAINGERLVWERLTLFPGSLTPLEIAMGSILILLVFEASRRAMGSLLGIIVLLSLIYVLAGPYVPGMWNHQGFSFEQMIDFTIFSLNGLFSEPIAISSTYIILFLIFAGFIQSSGAGKFYTNLALALLGKSRGGPGKVAVIGSMLFGSISSSAAANVALTGAITIPMMKSVGFKPYFAGAVEATAATGGHIMPPIMGGTIFIMMGFVGISYWNLAILMLFPALLYFLGIFIQVHAVSVREGIGGVDPSLVKYPSLGQTLKSGWEYLIPFIVIVSLLAYGFSPIRAALYSMPVAVVVSWFRKEDRIGIKGILKALESGTVTIRVVMLACALAGILMGAVYYTSAASTLVAFIRTFTGDMLFPALLLAAAFCLFLGLALSGVASYLLTAVLVIPATVSLGVPMLAAHLFAIYYSSVANITPPTGGTFFMTAAMADAPPYKTGWQAMKLACAAFVAPFVFVYRPAMLLMGSPAEIAIAMIIGALAVTMSALIIEGYFIKKLNILERLLLALGTVGLIFALPLLPTIAAAILIAVVLGSHWLRARRAVASNAIT